MGHAEHPFLLPALLCAMLLLAIVPSQLTWKCCLPDLEMLTSPSFSHFCQLIYKLRQLWSLMYLSERSLHSHHHPLSLRHFISQRNYYHPFLSDLLPPGCQSFLIQQQGCSKIKIISTSCLIPPALLSSAENPKSLTQPLRPMAPTSFVPLLCSGERKSSLSIPHHASFHFHPPLMIEFPPPSAFP